QMTNYDQYSASWPRLVETLEKLRKNSSLKHLTQVCLKISTRFLLNLLCSYIMEWTCYNACRCRSLTSSHLSYWQRYWCSFFGKEDTNTFDLGSRAVSNGGLS